MLLVSAFAAADSKRRFNLPSGDAADTLALFAVQADREIVFSPDYNKSTTFDVNIGRYGPFGNEYPGAGGEGRDVGVRLDLWKDKLSLRVNRYENTLGPRRATNEINDPARNRIYDLENRVLTLDPSLPTINVTDGNGKGYRTQGRPNYWILRDHDGRDRAHRDGGAARVRDHLRAGILSDRNNSRQPIESRNRRSVERWA